MPYKDPSRLSVLTTRLPAEQAEAFRQLAEAAGVTPSRMLSDMIRREIRGERPMETGKEKTVVTYTMWASTAEAMREIAATTGVPVDDLVNGVLCEFIAKFGKA